MALLAQLPLDCPGLASELHLGVCYLVDSLMVDMIQLFDGLSDGLYDGLLDYLMDY